MNLKVQQELEKNLPNDLQKVFHFGLLLLIKNKVLVEEFQLTRSLCQGHGETVRVTYLKKSEHTASIIILTRLLFLQLETVI